MDMTIRAWSIAEALAPLLCLLTGWIGYRIGRSTTAPLPPKVTHITHRVITAYRPDTRPYDQEMHPATGGGTWVPLDFSADAMAETVDE